MKTLFLLTGLLIISANLPAVEMAGTAQQINAIAEQCRLEAEESDVPPEEREQYIRDCIAQLNPQSNDQQRLQKITEQCKTEAEESGILPDEYEEYIRQCVSQQNPWDEDDWSDDSHSLGMD